ncbi:RNA guanine-N7 methyltransferase activating subunit-like [Pristis pectinata]|uniref:RNA guanine-N7 methyltransferase activating subunit-like n=1 Tax=Pristis pectinata TaxID=685728 RepID=UPI00223E39AF|nr:RNA guanine-N7 methyltransferase activating subunit-like [Pristis pectinata]
MPHAEAEMDRGCGGRMSSETEPAPDYEEMFAHRFTIADAEYQEMVKSVADPPPIVEDWMSRPSGNRRSQDYRPYRGRSDNRKWSNNQPWQGRDCNYNRSVSYESYSQGTNSHWKSNHHPY